MDQQAIEEIVNAVMAAITATPQWTFLTDEMQTANNPVPEAEDEGPTPGPDAADPESPVEDPVDSPADPDIEPDGHAEPPVVDPPASPANPATPSSPSATTGESESDESGATPEELASMGDDEKAEYSRLSPTHQYGYMVARRRHCKPGGGSMQYSSKTERERYSRVESENSQLRGEVQALRADRTYRERYSKLSELNQIHDFDIFEEAEECKSMTDAQFQRHIDRTVSKYSRRDPNGGMPTLLLPNLEDDASSETIKKEKYSRRAVEIATKSNGTMAWADAVAQAKKEIDGKA